MVAKRLAEDVPEQQVVQELVSKGADIHLARDFVRRIAEKGPEPKSQPQVKEAAVPARLALPMDVTIGLVLAAAGLILTLVLYIMDTRSAGVYESRSFENRLRVWLHQCTCPNSSTYRYLDPERHRKGAFPRSTRAWR